MNHLSEDVSPGSDFLLFFPFLQGRTAPVWPNASASWINLYGSSSNATLWRSMLESISFEYLSWVNILRRVGVKPKRIIGQGGGSKSKLWNQIKADMLNIPYCTIQNSEQAVLGNAILAAYGVGDIKDIKATVGEWVRIKETFYPHPEKNKFYGKIYEYREKILNGPMHEIYEILVELKELKVPQTKSEKNV